MCTLRTLRENAARPYDVDEFARCEFCRRVSIADEPLYWVDVHGTVELRCSGCAFSCADCGGGLAIVSVPECGEGWEVCAGCARRVHGLDVGFDGLPPVLMPGRAGQHLEL